MQKLKLQSFCNLSDNVLKILTQNHITTILDFLKEDVTKLASLTKLNLPEILAIRNAIFEKISAPLLNGSILLRKLLSETRRQICTGIRSLDVATCGGIPVGYITEICGLAGSGKTQLAFQLAINCIMNTESTVLYIDTKGDFSAMRIQKMLEVQKSQKEMADIMHKIRVVHIWTLEDLVEMFRSIKNKTLVIENLALVIVDSLPCLMFQYLGDENKMGLSLLNTLVNYSRFIGNEFNVGIIYINIQTRWIDTDVCEIDDYGESSAFKEAASLEKRNRCLGKYWAQIPALVIFLEAIENLNNEHDSKQIKVSVIYPSNTQCHKNECLIRLNGSGFE